MPVLIDYRILDTPADESVRSIPRNSAHSRGSQPRSGAPPFDSGVLDSDLSPQSVSRALAAIKAFPGGRKQLVTRASNRFYFFSRLLIPLLDQISTLGLDHLILAWDIVNELDAARDASGSPTHWAFPDNPAVQFISEAIRIIRGDSVTLTFDGRSHVLQIPPRWRGRHKSTVGWLRASSLPSAWGLGLNDDVPQYHPYVHGNASGQDNYRVVRVVSPEGLISATPPPETAPVPGIHSHELSFWRVPEWHAVSRGPRHRCIAGELSPTLGDASKRECWIAEMGLPLERFGMDAGLPWQMVGGSVILRPSGTPREPPPRDGDLIYVPRADTLSLRLLRMHALGYKWVFLWSWNSFKEDSARHRLVLTNSIAAPPENVEGVDDVAGYLSQLEDPAVAALIETVSTSAVRQI